MKLTLAGMLLVAATIVSGFAAANCTAPNDTVQMNEATQLVGSAL